MNFCKMLRVSVMAFFLMVICIGTVSAADKLAGYGADLSQTSVSGLSSGGFMTAQFHTAYSGKLIGAGIVAAGPFYCSGSYPSIGYMKNAMETCMNPMGSMVPDGAKMFAEAKKFAKAGLIDDPENLKKQKVYIFSGSADKVVATKVVDQVEKYYQAAGVPQDNIKYVKTINAGHSIIVNKNSDIPCSANKAPFINDCGFIQSHEILRHIYGDLKPPADSPSGKIVKFDQSEFADVDPLSMSKDAYVYVPKACETAACKVHIVLHGCLQGAEVIGDKYYASTGYNEMADTNNIIMLYPQDRKSVV